MLLIGRKGLGRWNRLASNTESWLLFDVDTYKSVYFVDIGMIIFASPALDVAALCLSLWPAAISASMLTLVSTTVSHIQDMLVSQQTLLASPQW